jgi:hypothetical protein
VPNSTPVYPTRDVSPRQPAKCRTLANMAGMVELQNTGDPKSQRDIVATVEHVLSDRPGDWRVLIAGSQGSDGWEMKIFGPNAFERYYILEGASGEHEPRRIATLVARMVLPERPATSPSAP